MKTVEHLLADKGRTVWSVAPGDSVYRLLEELAARGVGAMVVMDGDQLAGIVSERDYVRKVDLLGKQCQEATVAEIMSADVTTVSRTDTVEYCMELMTDKRFRHLPVVEEGRVVGVVSIGDVVRAAIAEREQLIDQLERYITSS